MLIHRARGAVKDKRLEERGDETKGQDGESEVDAFTSGEGGEGKWD